MRRFSFKLTVQILLKMTEHKYNKTKDLYCQKYYSGKLRNFNCSNDDKHFKLLMKVKPYFPEIYYRQLNKLENLSTKQWTSIFIYEVETRKNNLKQFPSNNHICCYFRYKPLLKRVILKKFKRFSFDYLL